MKIREIEYKYSKNRQALLWNALSKESKILALKALEVANELEKLDPSTSSDTRDFDKAFIKQFVTYLPDEDCYLIK